MCGLTPAEQSAAVGKGNKERGRPRKKGTPKARAANPKAKSAPKPKAKAKAKAKAKSQAKQTAHDTGKRRRSKNTTAPKAAPVVEDTGDTTASGSDAKDDSTHAEVAEAKAPRKRMAKKSRKAQKVEKTTEAEAVEQDDSPAPKSKAPGKKKKGKLAPTSAPAEASTSPVGKAKSKPTKKGNATKSTRAKAESQSAGSSKAEGSTVDDKKLQQKQKNARKSLAYRQAYKKAKDEGLDDDACKAAGRKVLWQHLLIYNLVHDFHARKFHNDFVVTFGSTQAGLSLGIKAYKDAEWAGRAKTFGHGTRCFPMKVSVVASRINKGIESRPQRKNVVRSCLMSWGLGVTGEFKATALLKKHVTGLINSLILVTRGLRIWPRRPFRVALGVSVLKMEPCLTLQHASQQKHQYSILKKKQLHTFSILFKNPLLIPRRCADRCYGMDGSGSVSRCPPPCAFQLSRFFLLCMFQTHLHMGIHGLGLATFICYSCFWHSTPFAAPLVDPQWLEKIRCEDWSKYVRQKSGTYGICMDTLVQVVSPTWHVPQYHATGSLSPIPRCLSHWCGS